MQSNAREPSPPVLGAAYFANYGALAVHAPFLAVYLAYRGMGEEAIAELLALLLLIGLVATPGWTLLADRLQSTALVLRIVSVGSVAMFALVYFEPRHLLLAIVLLIFGLFRAPFGALLDSIVLRWAARTGRPFGALRAWGTGGYTLGALAAGALVDRYGPPFVAHATLVALAFAALVSFGLPRGSGVVGRPSLLRPLGILMRRPRFLLLIATASLHEMGLAPYDSLFAAYVTGISTSSYAGASVAIGALAELVFMMTSGPLFRRLGAPRVLTIAYAASALRWGLNAVVVAPLPLILLQTLHAFSFGAFYLASIAIVDEESPAAVRASAQGVYSAFTFGVAAAVGLSLAGVITRNYGMRGVFAFASAAAIVAMFLSLAITRTPSRVAESA